MGWVLLTGSGVEEAGAAPGPGPGKPGWPPLAGRAPLPVFPQASGVDNQPPDPQAACWSDQGDYVKTPPANIPMKPDRRWHRGNFCGVSVSGVSGGYNDKDKGLIMTWELPTFLVADQDYIIWYWVVVLGYTHIVLSIPQAKNFGVTLEALSACAKRCKAGGLFVEMIAVSDGKSFSEAIPWLQYMLDAGALVSGQDLVCGSWQVDKWYEPEDVCQLIIDNGEWSHAHGLLTTIHWGGGYAGWAENCACWNDATQERWGIHNRWTFQAVLNPWLDGHDGQCNVDAPIDAKQSWLLKALVAMPKPMFLVAMETNAQGRYDTPKERPEVWTDMDGLLCTYADPDGRISYGNGARRPDGTVW